MSKIDFTPADTTKTGFLESSNKSALTSIDSLTSRWTPPIPPATVKQETEIKYFLNLYFGTIKVYFSER